MHTVSQVFAEDISLLLDTNGSRAEFILALSECPNIWKMCGFKIKCGLCSVQLVYELCPGMFEIVWYSLNYIKKQYLVIELQQTHRNTTSSDFY